MPPTSIPLLLLICLTHALGQGLATSGSRFPALYGGVETGDGELLFGFSWFSADFDTDGLRWSPLRESTWKNSHNGLVQADGTLFTKHRIADSANKVNVSVVTGSNPYDLLPSNRTAVFGTEDADLGPGVALRASPERVAEIHTPVHLLSIVWCPRCLDVRVACAGKVVHSAGAQDRVIKVEADTPDGRTHVVAVSASSLSEFKPEESPFLQRRARAIGGADAVPPAQPRARFASWRLPETALQHDVRRVVAGAFEDLQAGVVTGSTSESSGLDSGDVLPLLPNQRMTRGGQGSNLLVLQKLLPAEIGVGAVIGTVASGGLPRSRAGGSQAECPPEADSAVRGVQEELLGGGADHGVQARVDGLVRASVAAAKAGAHTLAPLQEAAARLLESAEGLPTKLASVAREDLKMAAELPEEWAGVQIASMVAAEAATLAPALRDAMATAEFEVSELGSALAVNESHALGAAAAVADLSEGGWGLVAWDMASLLGPAARFAPPPTVERLVEAVDAVGDHIATLKMASSLERGLVATLDSRCAAEEDLNPGSRPSGAQIRAWAQENVESAIRAMFAAAPAIRHALEDHDPKGGTDICFAQSAASTLGSVVCSGGSALQAAYAEGGRTVEPPRAVCEQMHELQDDLVEQLEQLLEAEKEMPQDKVLPCAILAFSRGTDTWEDEGEHLGRLLEESAEWIHHASKRSRAEPPERAPPALLDAGLFTRHKIVGARGAAELRGLGLDGPVFGIAEAAEAVRAASAGAGRVNPGPSSVPSCRAAAELRRLFHSAEGGKQDRISLGGARLLGAMRRTIIPSLIQSRGTLTDVLAHDMELGEELPDTRRPGDGFPLAGALVPADKEVLGMSRLPSGALADLMA